MSELDTGPITHAEAREIGHRFNASHWNRSDHEKARYSIPADPRRDDDLRLQAYIDQQESQLTTALARVEELDKVTKAADELVIDAQDVCDAIECCNESDLLALDNDQHPPSTLSVSRLNILSAIKAYKAALAAAKETTR